MTHRHALSCSPATPTASLVCIFSFPHSLDLKTLSSHSTFFLLHHLIHWFMGKTIAMSTRQVYSAMLLPWAGCLHPAGRRAGDPFVVCRSYGSGITQAAPSLQNSFIVSTAMAFVVFFLALFTYGHTCSLHRLEMFYGRN